MASRHLSLRMDAESFERLDAESRRRRQSRSELAKTLLEEGLRMEAHPGIVFRPGPGGRRAGLAAGPDVWEVVRVFEDLAAAGEDALSATAQSLALSEAQVRQALGYYSEFGDEIRQWIARLDEEAERRKAAWRREQQILDR